VFSLLATLNFCNHVIASIGLWSSLVSVFGNRSTHGRLLRMTHARCMQLPAHLRMHPAVTAAVAGIDRSIIFYFRSLGAILGYKKSYILYHIGSQVTEGSYTSSWYTTLERKASSLCLEDRHTAKLSETCLQCIDFQQYSSLAVTLQLNILNPPNTFFWIEHHLSTLSMYKHAYSFMQSVSSHTGIAIAFSPWEHGALIDTFLKKERTSMLVTELLF